MTQSPRRSLSGHARWLPLAAVLLIGTGLAATGGVTGAAAPRAISTTPASLTRRFSWVPVNDGRFGVRVAIHGRPVVWLTTYHPLANSPSTVASAAVIDQTSLRAGLFNGPLVPGGCCWHNGTVVMPAAKPSLVAAFNGGFEFRHMYQSGYKSEGRVMKPLQNGVATLVISKTGLVKVGLLGIDFRDDGTWVSIRQNLPAVVMNGASVTYTHAPNVWGSNYGGVMVSNRSAICTRADGRLMYVYVGMVDVNAFAKALVSMGCRFGMQLDINGTWPQFATYTGFGTTSRSGVVIDSRMTNPNRYVVYSQKDFIAFFDPATLPARVVV
ncbi:MAG: phosphodiester glycosidase family protein [Actinomycetota bacterium]